MSTTVQLPHWDMTVIFPALDSPEYQQEFSALFERLDALARLFDVEQIDKRESVPVTPQTVAAFETALAQFNELLDRGLTLGAYTSSFVATDSRDTDAQARMSELQQYSVKLSQLDTRFTAWIGAMDVDALIAQSQAARDHEYMLRKTRVEATHLMSTAEENLASELNITGGSAWARLHDNVTSQMMVPWEDGSVPMTVIRNLALDEDRDVRRRAYEAELQTWETVTVPLSAALNSIKGESNTTTSHRQWDSVLDYALFISNIDRQTLDAMMQAARESFPDLRRYLRAKARLLGIPALTWYDLFAPAGTSSQNWEWDAARDFLLEQFGSYSDRLREFAARAFAENWIDAEPRPGKRGGAFCMPIRGNESRVLSNFNPSYSAMSTLAHELGHAYHNFNMAGRTRMQRQTPMTLAETASIFCETIVRHAAIARGNEDDKLAILESSLENAAQLVIDISSRFSFEQAVLERRKARELSVDEFNSLMLDAQRETYGDGLDLGVLHPYMWEVKGHYYSTGRPFYNFPYMFGFLFGTGLYAQYRRDPEAFKAGYDTLLSSTGLADAPTLAAGFGFDVRSVEFWRSSLDTIREDVVQFEALVDRLGR